MWDWIIAAALQFPDVQARDLNGQVVYTRAQRGAPLVWALGFSYDSRNQVEAWTRGLVAATDSRLPVIVMPVYTGMPGPVRSMVDGVMASRTPRDLRRYVWTTTAYDELAGGLGLQAPKDAAIVLVDAQGAVRYLARGAPTPTAMRELLTIWRGLPAARTGG